MSFHPCLLEEGPTPSQVWGDGQLGSSSAGTALSMLYFTSRTRSSAFRMDLQKVEAGWQHTKTVVPYEQTGPLPVTSLSPAAGVLQSQRRPAPWRMWEYSHQRCPAVPRELGALPAARVMFFLVCFLNQIQIVKKDSPAATQQEHSSVHNLL